MKLKGLVALFSAFLVLFFSCTKLNEPTELGDELIPAVDNVNTFDTTLSVNATTYPFLDSSRNLINDLMALGRINDPIFGASTADLFFNLSSPAYGSSPFVSPDSLVGIDSVVLSLDYAGAYGDTTSNGSRISVDVSEINRGNDFYDTVLYRYDHPGFTAGSVLGSASFTPSQFRDTLTLIRKRDTTKVLRSFRVRLNNSLGQKLAAFDTTRGYKNDSLFRQLFRGLAVKVTGVSGPGALAYFNVFSANSGLNVYYRAKKDGAIDTASAVFRHATYSQANSIRRTPGGEYLANLGVQSPDRLYIQSAPLGSYASISVPGLTNFPNKIIHRAELIAYRVPSSSDNIFSAPNRLLLDHKGTRDTAFLFDYDIQPDNTGNLNLGLFGGTLRSDNSYRFNITRYIQGLVTRKEPNDSLRLYAPLRSQLFAKVLGQYVSINNLSAIANGRVVLAGPSYPSPAMRLRLRVVYSNL